MNDYSAIIKQLRFAASSCDRTNVGCQFRQSLQIAADVIEVLIKERDYYKDCADDVWDCCTKHIACEAMEKIKAERNELKNELCLSCGKYREAHNGACDGCRWK